MDNNIHAQGEQLTLSHNRRKRWYKLMCILAGIVVFCTVYALILPAITLTNATVNPGDSATIAVGETVTCVGSGGNRNTWSVSPENYVDIETSGNNATITGSVAGTVTVTHTYTNKGATETFTIIVTDTDSGGDDDESSIEKVADQNGYTVTVKGNQKILEGAELFVEEIAPDAEENAEYYSEVVKDMNASTFDFMKMYHIYLSKDGGTTEYDPSADETLSNTNINLQVTITYDTAPEGWPTGNGNLYVGHYKKEGSSIVNKGFTDGDSIKRIKVSGNSITFHINSFSVITMAAPTGAADTDTDITPGTDGTYGESLVQSAKNSWQIVSGGYEGNAVANKTVSTDGLVRVQKNVVPTDKENEFLIYLSIDKKVSWEEVIGNSNLVVTTSGGYKEKDIGTIITDVNGKSGEISPVSSGTSLNEYTATVTLTRNGQEIDTITQKYYGTVPNCSNGTGFLKLTIGNSIKYVIASVSVNLHEDGGGSGGALTYTVPIDTLTNSGFDFADFTVAYDGVSDTMGDYIEYDSVKAGDYQNAPTYDSATSILSWTPVEKAGLSPVYTDGTKITGWYLNSAELVYKVKLDVTKDSFQSAAEYLTDQTKTDYPYKTNETTTLSYHWSGEGVNARNTNFTSPQVRGLLYDVSFDKVDANDESIKLEGAEFGLKDSSGTVYSITETDEKGVYKASNLPYGTYTLTETKAPEGYSLDDENSTWEITLSYTDDSTEVAQDKSTPDNMIYTGNNGSAGAWQITNEKKNIYVDIIKTDMSYKALNGATFSIYDTDPSVEGAKPMDGCGELSANEFGVIVDDMLLENGKTYYLVETKAPDGYKLPTENVMLTVDMSVLSGEEEATGDAGSGTGADGSNEILPISATGGSGKINISKETQTIGDDETEATVYVIKIPNSPGVILPSTGGTGTLPYTLGGAGLVLAAALMYGYSMRRRKRERRLM